MEGKKLGLKNMLTFMIAFVCIVACGFALTGCLIKDMDRYTSVVPGDQEFRATLNYHWETTGANYDESWTVMRKTVNFCEQDRMVYYVEYSLTDNNNHDHDYSKTLLYFHNTTTEQDYVLTLNGTQWETAPSGDWSNIYGSYSKPTSFVYEFTNNINGRDFPSTKKVETTSEYIKYDFGRDNEVFKISNNPYHVLLYYSLDHENTHKLKEGTLSLGTPTQGISYLSTITPEMIGE